MGVSKRIFGGRRGYSGGKLRRALKNPPGHKCQLQVVLGIGVKLLILYTSVELGVVIDHEHDLPFKHVVVHDSTAYARYVLVILHLLELARKKACGGGRRSHIC